MLADDTVLAANRAFYNAFEAVDMDAMSDVWEHSDRATCVHPGWGRLHGWAAISASFFALFQNGQALQFILTNERVDVVDDVAWVSCDENILSEQVGGTVAALNVFARTGDGWRMVVHHGSSVVPRQG
ncbi:MAG: hypothetical protein QOD30_1018 [Actinomycetota bacterium]|jgi:ketosteroid isomerase-like protein|nr:hypothetical protein [Actinomycetota bacterium]